MSKSRTDKPCRAARIAAAWRASGVTSALTPADFSSELGRRDPTFVRVTSIDENLGRGAYEARTPAGQTASKPFTFVGVQILTPKYPSAINAGGPFKDKTTTSSTVPDPYSKQLAERRLAEASDIDSFEDKLKAERMAALDAEHRRLSVHSEEYRAEQLRTAAAQKTYPAPNSYQIALDAMKKKEDVTR